MTAGASSVPFVIELPIAGVTYAMTNGDGPAESGTVVVGWNLRPMTLDFRSSSGSSRLAIYDIVSESMRLALGGPGAPRPASLDAASVYTTR